MNKRSQNKTTAPKSGGRGRLTACVLVTHEPAGLERCLNSVKGLADEVVLVCTRSSNALDLLAETYAAKVVLKRWRNDFAALRNAGLEAASGEWILSLDASEWLTAQSVHVVRDAMNRSNVGGWKLLVRNMLEGTSPDECFLRGECRLFRNAPSIRFERSVCETVEPSILRANGEIAVLEGTEINNAPGLGDSGAHAWGRVVKMRLLQQNVEQHPDDLEHLFNLGSEFYALGDFAQAERYFSQAAALAATETPLAPMVFSLLIVSLREIGSPEDGVAAAKQAETLGLESAELSFARAWAHMGLREFAEAAHYFQTALWQSRAPLDALLPSDPSIGQYRAAMGLALALIEGGQTKEALQFAMEAVAGCPGKAEPLILLGCTHQLQGSRANAIAAMEEALSLDPSRRDALDLAASLYEEEGQPDRALEMIDRLLSLRPDHPRLLVRRAGVLASLGRRADAVTDAEHAQDLAPDSVEVLVESGKVYAACCEYEMALGCFEMAMIVAPAKAAGYFACGEVLYKTGAYGQAVGVYKSALEIEPGNAAGLAALGNAYAKSGHLEPAMRSWERALELKPDLSAARNNLEAARGLMFRAA